MFADIGADRFERPASDVKVMSILSRNAQGYFSAIDEVDANPDGRMRFVSFCLWGASNILCGNAKIPTPRERAVPDQSSDIKRFVRGIELIGTGWTEERAAAKEGRTVRFSPDKTSKAVIKLSRQDVIIQLTAGRKRTITRIAGDTEKPITIKVEDYNFDGYKDFSISSIDEGKGTYDIYRLFAYSASRRKFVEIRPACGDGFINVRLNKKKRTLTNSYYNDNVMTACTKKY